MNEFQIALLIGAAITALISWRVPHALLWISLGAIDAAACDIWSAYDLAWPAAFTLGCDALLCLSIHWLAEERWELRTFNIYQLSVLISILKLPGVIESQYVYATITELLNWGVLLLIGGVGIMGRIGASGLFFHYRWRDHIYNAYSHLRSPRKTAHWHKVQ
jgi:hypothetical protein